MFLIFFIEEDLTSQNTHVHEEQVDKLMDWVFRPSETIASNDWTSIKQS